MSLARLAALLVLLLAQPAAARVGVRIEVDGPVEGPFHVRVWTQHPAGIHASRSAVRDVRLVGPGWSNFATGFQLPLYFDVMWVELYHPDFLPETYTTRNLLAFLKPTAVTFRPRRWDDVLSAPGPIRRTSYDAAGLNAALDAPGRYLHEYLPALDDAGSTPAAGIHTRFAERIWEAWRRSEPAFENARAVDAWVGRTAETLVELEILLAASREQRLALRSFRESAAHLDLHFTPDDARRLAAFLEATLQASGPRVGPPRIRHVWTNADTKLRWSYVQELRRTHRKGALPCEAGRLAVDPSQLVGGRLRPHPLREYRVWCRTPDGTWHERTDRRRLERRGELERDWW